MRRQALDRGQACLGACNSGSGGSGGSGGSTDTALGGTCVTDSDCGVGLKCCTPISADFGSGGPARGYCSRPCTQESDCTVLAPDAQCINLGGGKAVCLEGCNPTSSSTCHGRYDSLCLPLSPTGVDGGSGAPVNACIPFCASDNDCAGLKCDLHTGLCTPTPTSGDPIGSSCNPQATTDPCVGFCMGVDPNSIQGSCTALCSAGTLGQPGACGSDPTQGSPQDAACLFHAPFAGGGGVGMCGQLCNCDSECHGNGDVCESRASGGVSNPSVFATAFKKAGLCVPGTGADGGTTPGIPTCPGGTSDGGG